MDRNIPQNASEAIDFYLRTIYSVLKSSSDTRISGFEEAHSSMDSVLHHDARSETIDFNALIYGLLRLPNCFRKVQRIVLGQHTRLFKEQGYTDIDSWEIVTARARRRFCQYDGEKTLACFITSRSDIDDIIPVLTAIQIEWNKLHYHLAEVDDDRLAIITGEIDDNLKTVAKKILAAPEDFARLCSIWGSEAGEWLSEIKNRASEMRVRLLDSSLIQYMRSSKNWIANILHECPEVTDRPIYFTSSNTHSITNMLSGYALSKQTELVEFMNRKENQNLYRDWKLIREGKLSASPENLLYYVLKKYQATPEGEYSINEQLELEQRIGITRVSSLHTFDVEAQLIDLSKIDAKLVDRRVRVDQIEALKASNGFIFNIDYPLGMTAYNILSKVSEEFERLQGVYIMGKAASLNGIYGDVIIPSVVQDMHSLNTYLFQNAFSSADIEPWLTYGSILDHQRAVSVFGTFLQNYKFIEEMYRSGYTDIEMEAGPFLSAVSEMFRPNRHPIDQIVSLNKINLDVGIIHYVSDTPMSKGKNLGAGTLSYFGMDSTYASSTAILRRILIKEINRIQSESSE